MKAYRKRNIYDWILEILSLLCLLLCFYPLLFYCNIDKNVLIPIHYNIRGEIDGWGSRYFLLIIPAIGVGLYLLLLFFECLQPKKNLLLKINSKNIEIVHRLKVRMLRHLKLFSMLIFAYINISSYFIAIGKEFGGLNKYVMIILLASILSVVVFYYLKMMFYKDKIIDNE